MIIPYAQKAIILNLKISSLVETEDPAVIIAKG